jgi:hypothetical protein
MGKKQKVSNMVNRGYEQDQRAYTDFFNQIMGRLPAIQERGMAERNRLTSGYENFLGSIPGRFGDARSRYGEISRTGGIDEAARQRMRGGGVYDEFSRTGGMTPQMMQDIRARTASQVPSFFSGLKDNFTRMNAVQGGMNPGYSGQTAKLSRDAAREATSSVRDTEMGLADSIRSGRMWGAEGMTSSEGALQALLSRNIFEALGGLTDIGSREGQLELGGLGGLQNVAGMQDPELDWIRTALATLGGRSGAGQGWTGIQGREDQARWDRKRSIIDSITGGVGAIVPG